MSMRLLEHLESQGHDGTATVRVNRVEKAPLIEPQQIKNCSVFFFANVEV